jgi:hypothetical protein
MTDVRLQIHCPSHLTESFDFTLRYLLWIPHRLSDDQNPIKVNLSRELSPVFEAEQARGWHDIVTLDKF